MKVEPPSHWLAQVENAHSIAELMRIARDYLSALAPEEAAQLPAGIRPEALREAHDMQEWAVTLTHHDLRGGAETPPALHRTAIVFAAAAARMSRVPG